MAVTEHRDTEISVPHVIDALETLAGTLRLDHARVGPPATRTPHPVRFWRGVAKQKIVCRALDPRPLEPWPGVESDAADGDAAGGVRPKTIKIAVDAVPDFVTIESPIPPHAIVELPAFDRRAMEEVGLVFGVTNHGGAPPVSQRGGRIIIFVLIAVGGKNITILVRVKLHIQGNLAQIVLA